VALEKGSQSSKGTRAANLLSLFAALGACVAAIASMWQARIFKDTEFRQLRAYLYVSHDALQQSKTSAGTTIFIKHSGATPAYNVRIDANALVGTYVLNSDELGDPITMGGSIHKQVAILNGTDQLDLPVTLSNSEAVRLLNATDKLVGDHALYVHGIVRYQDVFSVEGLQPERKYEFCFSFRPNVDVIGTEYGCDKYNKPG
jgi:hypothetical protein